MFSCPTCGSDDVEKVKNSNPYGLYACDCGTKFWKETGV